MKSISLGRYEQDDYLSIWYTYTQRYYIMNTLCKNISDCVLRKAINFANLLRVIIGIIINLFIYRIDFSLSFFSEQKIGMHSGNATGRNNNFKHLRLENNKEIL